MLSGAVAVPSLTATSLTPATTPLNGFFAEGTATTTLTNALPVCTITSLAGSFLELHNVNTGFVAGRHGPFNNTADANMGDATSALWDTDTYPVLKASYTGLYICRTDTGNSTATYQLNVRGKFTL